MAETFALDVATPERMIVQEQVTEAQVPGLDGYMGVLPGHAALLSELANGVLSYVVNGKTSYLAVHGGFVEIQQERVRVLADAAERKEEIDIERAREELKRASEALAAESRDAIDPARALEDMKRAQARVDAASKQ
jgi:F-type H+-transporting ATPase subunit epsilon